MSAEVLYAAIVVGVALAGLLLSNLLYDRNVPQYLSRKVGHSAGGLAFLLGVLLFSSAWWAIVLSALFGVVFVSARFVRPNLFRGVGATAGNPNKFSEVWFAWIAVPVFGIGWLWLEQPFVALTCLLFMAWGDCVTGIVRARV